MDSNQIKNQLVRARDTLERENIILKSSLDSEQSTTENVTDFTKYTKNIHRIRQLNNILYSMSEGRDVADIVKKYIKTTIMMAKSASANNYAANIDLEAAAETCELIMALVEE